MHLAAADKLIEAFNEHVHKGVRDQRDPETAIMINLPLIVKAREDTLGRRLIECEVSNEERDAEGDVIDQAALMGSAKSFLEYGAVDFNHYSELGTRLGIPGSPSDWIIGSPKEVIDLGKGRTGVVSELRKAIDGSFDPARIYDAIWRDLTMVTPPVKYRASIYGFPKSGQIDDCREKSCSSGATRYHIKGMDWKSLALTTSPVNDSITGYVKVVTAKSFITLIKGGGGPLPFPMSASASTVPISSWVGASEVAGDAINSSPQVPQSPAATYPVPAPRNLSDAVGHLHTHLKSCPYSGGRNTTAGFSNHFSLCCGMDNDSATLFGHALMHHVLLSSRRA